MSIKDLPNFKMENTCINRRLLLNIQECWIWWIYFICPKRFSSCRVFI